MREFLCIKIGGSVISDKSVAYKANVGVIRDIARSLKKIQTPLLIGHGSGSFGHTSAKKYGGKNGYTNPWGIAKVARDAQEINRIVMDIFIDEGLPAVSFSPRSFLLTEKAKLQKSFFDPLRESLDQGLMPVIYGDVIWDTAQKTTIYSGETILNALCRYLQKHEYTVTKIIQLCNVDGVLDAQKNVIPEITSNNWNEVKKHIEQLHVADVTGGMGHKVEDALRMTKYGIETWLLNGNSAVQFNGFMKGDPVKGTVIR